ncbi:peptide chain release factor 1 [Desulfurispira natronophila]|uniref:Peptide chain release factor 1 n=1 Tax=Desulfurispira natronophila TaxID=682562 RepID=A0A7W8DG01_9BACT|nr:peptide chain release factor 1 [Desulfurispira natronophila]MBB5020912.1 peptide chain release factor 1 [Desulfurispira natronophila]
MLEKLYDIEERYQMLSAELSQPGVAGDSNRVQQITCEISELREIVETFQRYQEVCRELEENETMLSEEKDRELRDLIQQECSELIHQRDTLHEQLRQLLIPKDPNDDKNVILEVRAGTGGEEASLFAADLFRMYSRYADSLGWKMEILSTNDSSSGGFKEIVCLVQGRGVYGRLKFESGTHRVQRVPETESQGRIHTSAVTVAVLPEAQEVDIEINPSDLRIDVYRSSGAGGQHVNTTDSAVRITHVPTGVVVACQDGRSQHKNKEKALQVLRSRLLDHAEQQADSDRSQARKEQVGSGDRSERIRTYNFPQGRVTDHRINLTLHRLDQVLAGDLEEIIDTLIQSSRAGELSGKS